MNYFSSKRSGLILLLVIFGASAAVPRLLAESPDQPAPDSGTAVNSHPIAQRFEDIPLVNPADPHSLDLTWILSEDSGWKPYSQQVFSEFGFMRPPLFSIAVIKKDDKNRSDRLFLQPVEDPQVLERIAQKLTWQKTLSHKVVLTVYEVVRRENYLYYVTEDASKSNILVNSAFPLISGSSNELDYELGLQGLYNLISEFHSGKWVAINFDIVWTRESPKGENFRLTNLGCAVEVGQEVGKCLWDPLMTDPLVLEGDPTLKADLAMDLYVWGIELLMAQEEQINVPVRIKTWLNEKVKTQDILGMKKSGKYLLKKTGRVDYALLTAFLLQKDRNARADLEKIRKILKEIYNDSKLLLAEDLEYDWTIDPLSVPEFQPFLSKIKFTKEGELMDLDDEKATKEWLAIWKWWIVGGVGAVSLLIAAFILWPKKPETAEHMGPDVVTQLEGDQTAESPVHQQPEK